MRWYVNTGRAGKERSIALSIDIIHEITKKEKKKLSIKIVESHSLVALVYYLILSVIYFSCNIPYNALKNWRYLYQESERVLFAIIDHRSRYHVPIDAIRWTTQLFR